MKETLVLRVNREFADLLFQENEGKNLGSSVKRIEISSADPRYNQIPVMENFVRRKYNRGFLFGWEFIRKYSNKELERAKIFQLKITSTFEPAGEECGTLYDESAACNICGAGRLQLGPLRLKKSSIPKKDIMRTIAGEIVVSDRFKKTCDNYAMKGAVFTPVLLENGPSDYWQLCEAARINLSVNIVAGINPFDLSTRCENEVYRCPKGHTLGLNLLSEVYVVNNPLLEDNDFFRSHQMFGVSRGLLRPQPVYLCSQQFRRIALKENLKGLDFEVAYVEESIME